jgi:LytS/YehU family sensor histidine kinase
MAQMTQSERAGVRILGVRVGWLPTPVHAALAPVGLIGGLGAALLTFSQTQSGWLAFFIFAVVTFLIARDVPDVMTQSDKVQRALYAALWPVASAVVLAVAYMVWHQMALAVIVGFILGRIAHAYIGAALFPRIMREENERMEQRIADRSERATRRAQRARPS